MEKKNTGLIVLVIILSLLVLGLSGYIVYDKVLSKDDNNTNSNSDKILDNNIKNNIDKEETNYTTWTDYILNQNVESVTLILDSVDANKNITLSNEQVKKLFVDLGSSSITKGNSGVGCGNGPILKVEYSINDNEYNINISCGILNIKDIEDSKLFDFINNNVTNNLYDGNDGFFFIDNFNNIDFDIYSESN